LLNVAFAADSPDRATAISSYKELQGKLPHIKFNLILIDKLMEDVIADEQAFHQLIYPKVTHMDFNIAIVLRYASMGVGVL
jgi:hypothetical protein